MPDLATADLIFSSDQANHNFARVLGDLRRAHLSIRHRLASICRDAAFVRDVVGHYGLPVVANERCGSWYVPADLRGLSGLSGSSGSSGSSNSSAYFKSTDGHTGQWAFSTRRLNLHLLAVAAARGGLVLVDSTRGGKRMPDALSKTVPLWCCVVNGVLFPEAEAEAEDGLYTPPGVVSASEHSQMRARVAGFVDALRRLRVLDDAAAQRRHPLKPLRPVWVTPDRPLPDVEALRERFSVIVCCTASRVPSSDDDDNNDGCGPDYIQGAGDDTENWAHGLTPAIFWAHRDLLLAAPEADLPGLIASLVGSAQMVVTTTTTKITPYLAVGQWEGPSLPPADPGTCQIVFVRQATDAEDWAQSPRILAVGLGKQDKAAARSLRYALPQICRFVSAYLARADGPSPKQVHVSCATGRDISVGTALALLCACFDEAGQPAAAAIPAAAALNKEAIRVRLGRILAALPLANPSRATLQSVNSFVMDWRK